MMPVPRSAVYKHNATCPEGYTPCLICGKATANTTMRWVRVHNGGSSIVTKEEATVMDPAGDMGYFPVGESCLRKYKQILPYLVEIE